MEISLKNKLYYRMGEFMAALLLVQPLLDVLSFCFKDSGATVITTALRFVLLVAVSLYGFAVTDRKELYYAAYGLVGCFWFLHALNCLRVGYNHPVSDVAEFLKLVQFPLWTLSFVTFFRNREGLDIEALSVIAANMVIILVVIALSYMTGTAAYTYDYPERGIQIGVMGWFGVHSAQCAILCMIVPAVLLWALRSENLILFACCGLAGFALLYMTGTRMTYFAAILLSVAFLTIIIVCRKPMVLCLPMLIAFILLLVLMGRSPMSQRQTVSAGSYSAYQEKIDAVMGDDKAFVYNKKEETDPAVLKKIEKVYKSLYGKEGIYGETLLGGLIDRFGVEKVMKAFDYSINSKVLNNARTRKITAMKLLWEEEGLLTHLLGMEYSKCEIDGVTYAPENDFPALLYFNGYLGAALYLICVLGIILYAAAEFIRRFPTLLNAEFITAAIMLALGLGAALISGNVLRRPNVTVYLSLAAATLFVQAEQTPSIARLRPGHKRNPAVYLKKIG